MADDLQSQVGEARSHGYTDDQIVSYLSSKRADLRPKITEAQKNGYAAVDIVNHLAPTDPGFLKGVYDSTVGGVVNGVKRAAQTSALNGGGLSGGIAAGADFAANAVKSQIDQGSQAVDAFRKGDYSRAALHGMGAIVPAVGPAVAQGAEAVANPNTRRYGAGQLVGTAAALAAPEVAEVLSAKIPGTRIGGALDKSAEANWYKALNPTTKANKALVQDTVAPGLAERGVVATSLGDLSSKASAKTDALGAHIDDIFDREAQNGTTVDPKPILDALDKERQGITRTGGTILSVDKPYAQSLDSLKADLQSVAQANGGQIPVGELRGMRQSYDKAVKGKNGFALPLADQSQLAAVKVAGDAIRNQLASQVSDLAPINQEFSFWKNTGDVAEATLQRRVGQRTPLTENLAKAGAAALAAPHGITTAYAVAQGAGMLAKLRSSTLWNSLSAATKTQLSDLASSGDMAGMFRVAMKAGGQTARIGQATSVPATQ